MHPILAATDRATFSQLYGFWVPFGHEKMVLTEAKRMIPETTPFRVFYRGKIAILVTHQKIELQAFWAFCVGLVHIYPVRNRCKSCSDIQCF